MVLLVSHHNVPLSVRAWEWRKLTRVGVNFVVFVSVSVHNVFK